MLIHCLLPLSALATLSAPATDPSDTVELRFAPAPETVLSTEFSYAETSEGADLAVWMNGGEVPSAFLPDLQFEYRLEVERAFADAGMTLKDGRIDGFTREFDAAERSGTGEWDYGEGADSATARAVSEFQGERLEYERDGDGFVGGNADEDGPAAPDLLEHHGPGLAWLLPEEAVEVGEEWELPADLLQRLRSIGGPVAGELGLQGAEWMEEADEPGAWEGELVATLTRVADGAAVIVISGETVLTETRATDLEQVPVADGTATETNTMTHVVEGELRWNTAAGLPVSLNLESRFDSTVETVRDEDQPGPGYRSELLFGGESQLAVAWTTDAP